MAGTVEMGGAAGKITMRFVLFFSVLSDLDY